MTENDLASKPCLAATFYVESPESRDDYMVDHRYTFTPTGCNARQDLQDPDIQVWSLPNKKCIEIREYPFMSQLSNTTPLVLYTLYDHLFVWNFRIRVRPE